MVNPNATRNFRKQIIVGVRNGSYPLKVVGNSKSGFGLAGERGQTLTIIKSGFTRQRDALNFGAERYGITPKITRLAA